MIQFIDVPLYTPTGDLLVRSINFSIKLGQNVIITGPNGSGKSSLFRLLGDLWPLYGGKLIKPTNNRLFYIPQKPYMALGKTRYFVLYYQKLLDIISIKGTFRDQIIYPDSHEDMKRKGITDIDLLEYLKIVSLFDSVLIIWIILIPFLNLGSNRIFGRAGVYGLSSGLDRSS